MELPAEGADKLRPTLFKAVIKITAVPGYVVDEEYWQPRQHKQQSLFSAALATQTIKAVADVVGLSSIFFYWFLTCNHMKICMCVCMSVCVCALIYYSVLFECMNEQM